MTSDSADVQVKYWNEENYIMTIFTVHTLQLTMLKCQEGLNGQTV